MDIKKRSPKKLETALDLLEIFHKKNRRMPSYGEITKLLNFKSKDSAWRIIQKLIVLGKIESDSKGKLIPKDKITTTNKPKLRLLGLVEAGFGSPSEEVDLDRISLDSWLIDDESSTFMLKVKGDSMIDAGIHPGDFCIVKRTTKANIGQIVVAEIDGVWTLKYLRKDKDLFYLEPANSKYKNIYPKEDLRINAVVKAVVRKYE